MISRTLIDSVRRFYESQPHKVFARLLQKGKTAESITYQNLLQNASRYANFYREKGVKEQEVIILILNHGPELLYAFVGALLLRAVPSIFAFPSEKISGDVYQKTLSLLLKVCNTRFVVTSHSFTNEIGTASHNSATMCLLLSDEYLSHSTSFDSPRAYKTSDLVLLQHSSGTTGLKKGVALSNEAILNQIRAYSEAIHLTDQDRIVSWLPLYHDMGLIACFVLPLATGVPVTMMSPFDWVKDPALLFEAIDQDRSTLCWLPNFSYNFLSNQISNERISRLNVSSVRAFINCAEPISDQSHQIFYERFKKFGLKQQALCTCYAMAENTFAVTQGGIDRPVKTEEVDGTVFLSEHKAVPATSATKIKRRLVSSGEVLPSNHIQIVDAQKRKLPDRQVGEIMIKSDSLLTEYYHRPDLTKDAFYNGWYCTGDLGYLSEGSLFVTGRKKDMIIVAGKNIYPQDIEEIVSSIEGIHPGRVVSFGVPNNETGTEDVVILAETDKTNDLQIKMAILRSVREQLECTVHDLVLLPPKWLLKSSSGKISRSGNREKYEKEIRNKNVVS